ncbi:MAG: hypothetical protein ACOY5B_12805 [Spirochaetota bacterium]
MSPKYLRILLLIILAAVALNTVACSNSEVTFEGIEQSRLKLADGSSISQAATDDYSPIIVRLSNGYLALVFASTRACLPDSCLYHNIFVASSVSVYSDSGELPAFNAPRVVGFNASPLNLNGRIRLAVQTSGNNIVIYSQISGQQISSTGAISPVSSVLINAASYMAITEYMCYSNNMLGLDATGQMIAANTAGTQVYRFNPNTSASQCMSANVANPKLSTGTHISLMRQSSTGISDGYVVSDTAGKVSAQSVTSSGPQLQVLVDGLASNGLVSTAVSVMQGASEAGDLITFSAAPAVGDKSDLYVLLAPKPAELWKRYVAAGTQPSP